VPIPTVPPSSQPASNRGEDQVDDRPDHDHVAQRAETGPLPQRDPQQQDQRAHDDRPGPDGDPGVPGQALVQDVPRVHAEPGQQQHGVADPVQQQAGEQLGQTAWHAIQTAKIGPLRVGPVRPSLALSGEEVKTRR